jgi:hypothetical protein
MLYRIQANIDKHCPIISYPLWVCRFSLNYIHPPLSLSSHTNILFLWLSLTLEPFIKLYHIFPISHKHTNTHTHIHTNTFLHFVYFFSLSFLCACATVFLFSFFRFSSFTYVSSRFIKSVILWLTRKIYYIQCKLFQMTFLPIVRMSVSLCVLGTAKQIWFTFEKTWSYHELDQSHVRPLH